MKIKISGLIKSDPKLLISMIRNKEIDPGFQNCMLFRKSIRSKKNDVLKSLIELRKQPPSNLNGLIALCYHVNNYEAAEILIDSYNPTEIENIKHWIKSGSVPFWESDADSNMKKAFDHLNSLIG